MYVNLHIKKTWATLCEFSLTQGVGLKQRILCIYMLYFSHNGSEEVKCESVMAGSCVYGNGHGE